MGGSVNDPLYQRELCSDIKDYKAALDDLCDLYPKSEAVFQLFLLVSHLEKAKQIKNKLEHVFSDFYFWQQEPDAERLDELNISIQLMEV